MTMIMKTVKVSMAFVMLGTAVYAQNLNDAKKAIDAEQYQKAKSGLKSLIAAKPSDAAPYFYLGNVYLKTEYIDSAKNVYTKGIAADAKFPLNYIGLGAIDLQNNNSSAAKVNFDKALSDLKRKEYEPYLYIGKAYTQAPKPDYALALEYLEKAKAVNEKDAEVHLALGDAYRGKSELTPAYSAYRRAFELDNTLYRAKVELGVITKRARAFPEADNAFNEVISANPNYGPAYRELAETYYLWANSDQKEYDAKIKQALQFYEKYMDLTDRSLESRMRRADFLILAKEYKALQAEAQEMSKIDKTNPRIFRYLGYAAFENGNYDESIEALKNFIAKVEPTRIIGKDYLFLGQAQVKAGQDSLGINNLRKAVELDSTNAEVMSDIAKALYSAKKYAEAAQMYDIAINNPKSKTIVYDNFYLGMAHYFDYATQLSANKDNPPRKDILVKADSAYSNVLKAVPTTQDALLYRARINRLLDDAENMKGLMVPFYEKYIEVLLAKPDAANEARNKANLVEAYNNLGAFYTNTDKEKAKDYFTKSVAINSTDNSYATDAIKSLESQ